MEDLEVVDLNNKNEIKINYVNIFPSEKNYNKCIVFLTKNNIDYILYAEKVLSTTDIAIEEIFNKIFQQRSCTINSSVLCVDSTLFSVVRLTPPKKITMKDVEEKFGGPVEIIK